MSSSSRLPQTLGELESSKEFYEARLKKRSEPDCPVEEPAADLPRHCRL
jgi:hypothetical protein